MNPAAIINSKLSRFSFEHFREELPRRSEVSRRECPLHFFVPRRCFAVIFGLISKNDRHLWKFQYRQTAHFSPEMDATIAPIKRKK